MPRRKILLALVLVPIALAYPGLARAIPAEYQQCTQSESCTIGEFLYDDSYAPITNAFCNITVRDPSGTLLLNSVAMSANSDGWYEYDVSSASATLGQHRSQICCNSGSDYLCIDKTFEINTVNQALTAQEVEDAVWDTSLSNHTNSGSTGEQLSNTSSLSASDVWGYTNRSLTSFGTLISDIWNSTTRTLTDNPIADVSDLATKGDVTSQTTSITNTISKQTDSIQTAITGNDTTQLEYIQNQIQENRHLLQQLLEDPIITSQTSTFDDTSLQSKLDQASAYLDQLYANTQQIASRLSLLLLNWDILSASELTDELTDILATLGNNPTSNDYSSTILNQLSWFSESWPNDVTTNTYQNASNSLSTLNHVLSLVDINNKASQVKTLLEEAIASFSTTENLIGNLSSPASDTTLFGFIKQLQQLTDTLKQSDQQLSNLLANWSSYNQTDLQNQLSTIEDKVLEVNLIPNPTSILANSSTDNNESLNNRAIALKALISLNQRLLDTNGDQPIETVWLETKEENIAFRSAVFNPSSSSSQTYHLKYYLPKELTLDNVLNLDSNLNKDYDTTEEKVFLEGSFNLSPRKLELQTAITKNLWQIPDSQLDSTRQQAQELLDTLEDTSFFGAGTQLKSDIDVALARIADRQAKASTPNDRIMTYRQSMLKFQTVQENLAKLNDLVTQANSAGSIFGFVGGVQAVSVWGIIIIVIAGFVFLTMYMKLLHRQEVSTHPHQNKDTPLLNSKNILPQYMGKLQRVTGKPKRLVKKPRRRLTTKRPTSPRQKVFHLAVIGLTSAALSAMTAGSIISVNKAKNDTPTQSTSEVSPDDSSIVNTTANQIPTRHQPRATSQQPIILGTQNTPKDNTSEVSLEPDQDTPEVSPNDSSGVNTPESRQTLTIPEDERYNLREKPSPEALIVTKLTGTIHYEVIEDTGEWVKVRIQNTPESSSLKGWLHQDLLAPNP